MNYTLKINLSPELDAGKFNALLSYVKKSLGALGQDIEFIDVAEYEASMKRFAETGGKAFTSIGDAAEDAAEKIKDFGGKTDQSVSSIVDKFAKFGLAASGLNTLASSISQVSLPFRDLDKATQSMKTLGDEAAEMAPRLREAAITMSKDLPFGAAEIQAAMTDALASGVQGGEKGLQGFAETAAKLATGGGAAIDSVVKGLGATLNAFGETSEETGRYADYMFNIVNAGVTTIDELNSNLSGVTPTAASMGLAFDKVGGSLALMTQKGVPTAQAVTKLNSLLVELAKPSAGVKEALDAAGVGFEDFKTMIANDDLVGALSTLQEGFTAAGKSATQAFSSSEAGAAFNLLMGDVNMLKDSLDFVSNTTGSTENAYQQMSETIEVRTQKMQAAMNAFLTETIDSLGPIGPSLVVMSEGLSTIAPQITALAGLGTLIPDNAITNISKYGTTLVNAVVPGMLTVDATTKRTVLNTNQLTMANVRLGATQLYNSTLAKVDAGSKVIQATATKLATGAQWGLNAAFLASPVGWVVAGIAAIVGAMYLLYENVEPVRKTFDAVFETVSFGFGKSLDVLQTVGSVLLKFGGLIFNILVAPFEVAWGVLKAISTAVGDFVASIFGFSDAGELAARAMKAIEIISTSIIDKIQMVGMMIDGAKEALSSFVESSISIISKIISLDFAGAAEEFATMGTKAGEAFGNEFQKQMLEQKWEKATDSIKQELEKGMKLNVQIDSKDQFSLLIQEYENAQKRITELQTKPKGSLTEDEVKELKKLEEASKKTAAEIVKINPELKTNSTLAVDAAGRLVEQYDLNIKKAKEFAEQTDLTQNLSNSKEAYSKALGEQAGIIDKQKSKLDELKEKIDQTNDPKQKDELIAKYNEELSVIDKNKAALIKSFVDGGKAGLVTQEAIDKIAKMLGTTSEEAKKMILAEKLKEASASGELTEEQIKKIATQFGVTEKQVKELLEGQKKITNETNNTANAAKGWGDALDEAKKKQQGANTKILEAQYKLNKGLITQEEYEKELAQAQKERADGVAETLERQRIFNDLRRKGLVTQAVEYKEWEKTNKTAKSLFEIESERFNKQEAFNKKLAEQSSLDKELERLSKGRALTDSQMNKIKLESTKQVTAENQKMLDDYSNILKIAKDQYDLESKRGKITEKTAANYETAKTKYQELENAVKKSKIDQLNLTAKIQIDKEKSEKEVNKILTEMELDEIKLKVDLGLLDQDSLVKKQIENLNKELTDKEIELAFEMLMDEQDAVKVATLKSEIQGLGVSIVDLNDELYDLDVSRRLNEITDLAERERQLSLAELNKTYNEELKLAGNNAALKEALHLDYLKRKNELDEQYLIKSSKLQDKVLLASRDFIASFSNSLTNSSANAVNESLDKLQAKLDELKKANEDGSETDGLRDEEQALIDSYRRREIAFGEMQQKINDINHRRTNERVATEKSANQTIIAMQIAMVESFGNMATALTDQVTQISTDLNLKIKANLEAMKVEGESKSFDLSKIFEGTSQDLQALAGAAAGSAISTFSALLVAGEEFGAAFRKGLLTDLIKTSEQAITANIPAIYSAFMKWLGPWGIPAATLALGTVYSSLALAKAELGRYKGEVDINGRGTSISDDNVRLVAAHESILTAKATQAPYSKGLYEWQNKTGGSPLDYFTKVNPGPLRGLIGQMMKHEIDAKTQTVILDFAKERDTTLQMGRLVDEQRATREEIKKGNYSRKERVQWGIDVNVNDKEIINRVKIQKEKELRTI